MLIGPVTSAGRVGWAVFALPGMPAMTVPVPLVSLLTAVDDPRRPPGQHHSLEAILLIATLAVICGTDNWTAVEFFGHQK